MNSRTRQVRTGEIPEAQQAGKDVYFTRQQIEYLQSMYPTRVLPATASEAEIHQYFGTQRVLETVKGKYNGG
jgi:hypothetical protein